ncbi:uncharacterized protein TNCV_1549581 [Trichonephila clavipes]|nr:uncharacterized protein TNCV_1549581 [Trichonephila clavipes]
MKRDAQEKDTVSLQKIPPHISGSFQLFETIKSTCEIIQERLIRFPNYLWKEPGWCVSSSRAELRKSRHGANKECFFQELWFQQDGATCHTARATIYLLKDTFGDRLISRFGPVNWPPRSCDLTPLDYFLWGYVKSLVYADKPQMLDHLEDNIHRVIADIRPQMLEKVIENWTSRLDYIRASRGSHMPQIIFKM